MIKGFINPKDKSELMADLTIELSTLASGRYNELSKKNQIKVINDTADRVFYIFRKNLFFKRSAK